MNTHLLLMALAVSLASLGGASFMTSFLSRRLRSVKYLTELLGQEYGFIRLRYEAKHIISGDGSSHTQMTEAIQAINSEVVGIEHYSQILTERPNQNVLFSVNTTQDYLRKNNGRDGKSADVKVKPTVTLATPRRLYYQLLYDPPLKPSEKVEYSYEVLEPPRSFAVSQAELIARKLPYDFISMKIAYPTAQFVMSIEFSGELRVEDITFDVWLGDGRLRSRNEFSRLQRKNALKVERLGDRQVVRFCVDYPVLDLKYVVTWRPSQVQRAD